MMGSKRRSSSPLDVLHTTAKQLESPTAEESAVQVGTGRDRNAAAAGVTTQVYSISPERLKPWPFANRRHIDQDSLEDLTDMIRESGQRLPALVRRISPEPEKGQPQYEIIYGVRRWYAAKRLDIPLKVTITDIGDREAALAMDQENRGHDDISVMDRARDYKAWYEHGLFDTKDAIARAASMNPSTLYRMFQIAELPTEIEDAFASAKEISFTFAYELSVQLDRNPESRERLIEVAKELAGDPKRSRSQRQAALLGVFDSKESGKEPAANHSMNQYRDIGDDQGRTIGRICVTRKGVIKFNTRQMSQEDANEMAEEITNFLANYATRRDGND